jgi:hypothetical protein
MRPLSTSATNAARRAKQLESCQGRHAKIFIFPKDVNYDLTKPSRLDTRDVRPFVTRREAGCDGRGRAARRAALLRTVKPCGSGSPMLESSLRVGDVGLRSDTPRRRWWLTSPAHQEERGAAVKPLRRECRSDFGVPVLACVRLFCLHARQWVRRAPGIPCALSFEGATRICITRTRNRAAGMMMAVRNSNGSVPRTRVTSPRLRGEVGIERSENAG